MADNKVNFLRGTSAEYKTKTKDNDTFYYTTDTKKLYLGENEITGIEIDDISTTATDKTWSAKKINDSIPTSLPANGGNADTLDEKHYFDFVNYLGEITDVNNILNNPKYSDYSYEGIISSDVAASIGLPSDTDTEWDIKCFRATEGSGFQIAVPIYYSSGEPPKSPKYRIAVKVHILGSYGISWGDWNNFSDGGNADTVDGKHASDFTQIINLGNTSTDTKSAIGILYKTTTYWCSAWTDYPTGLKDGQGMMIAVHYKGSGTTGADNIWCRQIFISPHPNTKIYQRILSNAVVGDWTNIADGGNAATVNGYTVNANVPAGFSPNNMMSKTNPTGTGSFSLNRKADTTIGDYSFAEGSETTASGRFSHAEGGSTTASADFSHAEGSDTTAGGNSSHAEGYYTKAANYASHASGKYNAAMTTGGSYGNTTGTAFVIGNGTGSSALSNAFSVQYSGIVKAKSTITASTTADYAEFFEWLDENPDDEDRVGYFVTLDGDKIRIATSADDYILGVVSGEPFVLGNGDCDTWNGMYLHDEFRRTIYEPAPKMIEILDSEGNPTGEYEEVEGEFEGTRPKLNPEYDHTQPYISRLDRKEWAPVGMLGVLAVRHDGTAQINGYVTVNAEGIATACEKSAENAYRVIKSNTDSVVEIIFR